MVVVGFDPDVARANGYEIGTRPDGTQYAIGADTSAAAVSPSQIALPEGVSPANVVTGDCGSSYVNLYDVGTRKYRVDTGFGVYWPTVAYTWSTNVIAPSAAYNYTHRWHGLLAGNYSFPMTSTATISRGSWTTAKTAGYTTHANGNICRSLGPISTEAIY